MEQFTFFWNGVFSQWYGAAFTAQVPTATEDMDLRFNCAEQYMMYMKAATFSDWATAKKIMASYNPKEQKALGRQVKPFNADVWNGVAKMIVKEGNRHKFEQNPDLKEDLMATAGTTLVEASPYDTIWGIGLTEFDEKAKDRRTWRGTNWLGEILTELREEFEQSPVR